MKVVFSEWAKSELDDATDYYDIGSPGLGAKFREEVRRAAIRISELSRSLVDRAGRREKIPTPPVSIQVALLD